METQRRLPHAIRAVDNARASPSILDHGSRSPTGLDAHGIEYYVPETPVNGASGAPPVAANSTIDQCENVDGRKPGASLSQPGRSRGLDIALFVAQLLTALGTIGLAYVTYQMGRETKAATKAAADANTLTARYVAVAERSNAISDSSLREVAATAHAAQQANRLALESNTLTGKLAVESRRPWIEVWLVKPRPDSLPIVASKPSWAEGESSALLLRTIWRIKLIGGGPARAFRYEVMVDSYPKSLNSATFVKHLTDWPAVSPLGSTVEVSQDVFDMSYEVSKRKPSGSCYVHMCVLVFPTVGDEGYYYEQVYRAQWDLEHPGWTDIRPAVWYHGTYADGRVTLERDFQQY